MTDTGRSIQRKHPLSRHPTAAIPSLPTKPHAQNGRDLHSSQTAQTSTSSELSRYPNSVTRHTFSSSSIFRCANLEHLFNGWTESFYSTRDWQAILRVEQQLLRLDERLPAKDYRRQEAPLLSQLNALMSTTRNVPDGILGLVFEYACLIPPNIHIRRIIRYVHTPVILGSVSSQWRRASRSSCRIWTVARIRLIKRRLLSQAKLLDLYLQNSGELSVHLELIWDAQEVANKRWLSEPITSVFFKRENVERIRLLRLEHPPFDWIVNQLTSPNLYPELEELAIVSEFPRQIQPTDRYPEFGTPVIDDDFLGPWFHSIGSPNFYSPSLRKLTLHGSITPLNFCWSTITVLRLRRLHPSYCFHFLKQCKYITEFDFSEPDVATPGYQLSCVSSPIVCSYIERFKWAYFLHPCHAFLSQLCLPRLLRLQWEQLSVEADQALILPFLSELPPGLETLELSETRNCDFGLLKAFFQRHALKRVILKRCDDLTIARVLTLFSRNNTTVLRDISLLGCFPSESGLDKNNQWIGRMLLQVLRRWSSLYPWLRVKVRLDFIEVAWPPEVQAGLKELTQLGLQLELKVRSETPPWFNV